MADFYSNSIFWVDIDKIHPNPYQPRREFEEGALKDLAESIRLYGVMQPLTVSRVEREKQEGGIAVEYELIAGERRMRASKLAGLKQVPVIIRVGDTSQEKLELAIIENLQRADLNPVERAKAFARLAEEFKLQHGDIGKKMGRSREYVSNTLRILALPEEMLSALASGRITEGHTRPLLMLTDRPEEQMVLFKEIMNKKVTVREAERAARNIAVERARRAPRQTDPTLMEIEQSLQKMLGERVRVEQDAIGGRVTISFLNPDELKTIMEQFQAQKNAHVAHAAPAPVFVPAPTPAPIAQPVAAYVAPTPAPIPVPVQPAVVAPVVPATAPLPPQIPVAPVVTSAPTVSVPTATPIVVQVPQRVAESVPTPVQMPALKPLPTETYVAPAVATPVASVPEVFALEIEAPAAVAHMPTPAAPMPTEKAAQVVVAAPPVDESDLYSINSFSL
jgi:ParB family chromosome partitioning protein